MNRLANMMRLQAQRQGSWVAHPEPGVVTSFDPVHYCAKVALQPSGKITGWLPIAAQWIGDGWGMVCPPSIDDVVNVYFEKGSVTAGWIEGRQFGGVNAPPQAPSGEFWLIHKTGSFFKLTNDGDLSINVESAFNITVNGATNLTSTGNVTIATPNLVVDGNILATGDITDNTGSTNESMRSQRATYDSHTHRGVQPGSGNTGTPNQTE